MIYKKLDPAELFLIEIIEHPVWNPEFLREEVEEGWEHTDYQVLVLADCNNHICFRAARATGKTETLIDKMVYFAINNFFPTPIIALVTPNRVHLNPIWRRLNLWLQTHPFLKHFSKSSNSQIFDITLANGVTIDCRIGGVGGTGATVIGLHTPVLLVDESGYMVWNVWIELLPTVNVWETGYQVYICGTPSGQRENNVLFFADQESEQYNKHRVTAFDNPRYDEDARIRDLEQYGGEESDDYQRLVLGEHASPVIMLFARDTLPVGNFNIFTATLRQKDLEEDPLKLMRLLESLPRFTNKIAAGIDLGYGDPTAISIFENVKDQWQNVIRLTLEHIEYPKQIAFIDKLDDIYDFSFLAIDEGHAGIAVSQILSSEQYNHKKYTDKLYSVMFGNAVEIGSDLDGNAIKSYVKNLAVEKLRSLFDRKQVVLSVKDDKLLSELERVESVKNPSGRVTYRVRTLGGGIKGDDHNFASLLCFAYPLYLEEDYIDWTPRVKLYGARWAKR